MRTRKHFFAPVFAAAAIIVLSGIVVIQTFNRDPRVQTNEDVRVLPTSATTLIGGLPLSFIENRGQTDAAAAFHVQAAGHTVLFRKDRIVFRRSDQAGQNEIGLRFLDAERTVAVKGIRELPGVAHFYRGTSPAEWQTNVPTFGSIEYEGLYPGVDLRYSGDGGTLESVFYLAPHANVKQIRMIYEDALSQSIREDGALVVRTELGDVIEKAPVAFQDLDGARTQVAAGFVIHPDASIGFALGDYDATRPLVIDPELVFLATFSSVGGAIWSTSVAIDGDGNLVVAGAANRFFSANDVIAGSNHGGGLGNDGLLMKLDVMREMDRLVGLRNTMFSICRFEDDTGR